MPTDRPITLGEIRERAYELWERNHRPEGLEIEFWLLAERELRAQRGREPAGDPPQGNGKAPSETPKDAPKDDRAPDRS